MPRTVAEADQIYRDTWACYGDRGDFEDMDPKQLGLELKQIDAMERTVRQMAVVCDAARARLPVPKRKRNACSRGRKSSCRCGPVR
jgi:hypothetical protein